MEILVHVYHKTNVPGLQSFLREKFASWTRNGSYMEEMWKISKEIIFESINRFILQNSEKKP